MQKKLKLLFFSLMVLLLTGCSYDGGDTVSGDSTETTGTGTSTGTGTTTGTGTSTGTGTTLPVLLAKSVTVSTGIDEDDAEEYADGSVDTSSADLDLAGALADPFTIGLRFTQLTIPQGSEITNAYIQFTADENNTRDTNLTIYGEKSANAVTFNTDTQNISKRNKTVVSVSWSVDEWIASERGVAQRSGDLSSIVQEIVDQDKWFSANSIVFVITGVGKRAAVSHKTGTLAETAELVVAYNLKDADTDEDGIRNSTDDDDDNDGVADIRDAFPLDATETIDTDGDGIGNNTDSDDDNDGVSDRTEIFDGTDPLDKFDFVDRRIGAIEAVKSVAKFHRVVWNDDASTTATIGFTPTSREDSFYIKFGQITDETEWRAESASEIQVFDTNLTSYFLKMTGLKANAPVYYRVCDGVDCGDRYWFKTAPNETNSSFVVVAGGDTKGDQTKRLSGNKLISKIRPLFVMHGGDFTNANNSEEMSQYLTDWVSTYSSDRIDNIEYKRIYPLVPTHGTNEDNDFLTMCKVFGLDSDKNGLCTLHDTYGAFNVSPLLRVYTLNSQLTTKISDADTMNTWFNNDIINEGAAVQWRIAQYHRPMITHTSVNPNNEIIFDWWAQLFFDQAMNLVVESDSNVAKNTKIVKPSSTGFDFVESIFGGTLYVGEGSWATTTRPADTNHTWTQDSASINQFKVMLIDSTKIEVSTAQLGTVFSTSIISSVVESNTTTIIDSNATISGETNATIVVDGNATIIFDSNKATITDSNIATVVDSNTTTILDGNVTITVDSATEVTVIGSGTLFVDGNVSIVVTSNVTTATEFNPSTLSYQERENNTSVLPSGMPWWNVEGIGNTTILKQNIDKQSISGN